MLLLAFCSFWGIPVIAQKKRPTDSVEVTIRFKPPGRMPIKDSVLVIFDRYDLAGAGIIKKVYHPVNNEIIIPAVPPARYYIEIACLGVNQERFTELTYVNRRHNNVFTYKVKKSGTFTPGLAAIPVEPVDPGKLKILREKL